MTQESHLICKGWKNIELQHPIGFEILTDIVSFDLQAIKLGTSQPRCSAAESRDNPTGPSGGL